MEINDDDPPITSDKINVAGSGCLNGLVAEFQASMLIVVLAPSCAWDGCRSSRTRAPAAVNAGFAVLPYLQVSSYATIRHLRRLVLQQHPTGPGSERHDGAQVHDDADENEEKDGSVPRRHGCHCRLGVARLADRWVLCLKCGTCLSTWMVLLLQTCSGVPCRRGPPIHPYIGESTGSWSRY